MFRFGLGILIAFLLAYLLVYILGRVKPFILRVFQQIEFLFAGDQQIKKEKYFKVLNEKNSYFKALSEKGKNKFVYRTERFARIRDFETREGLELTEEMKILISASAVQLSFGLRKFKLPKFTTIIIYPDIYYFASREEFHRGTTSSDGEIILSWKHFNEGYHIANDGMNLGLHEMTHALQFDYELGKSFDLYFSSEYEKFSNESLNEFENIVSGKIDFFREYASTNIHEFFAVCVESFFERSAEMQKVLPGLYLRMCLLLNQDPLNDKDDYLMIESVLEKRSVDHYATREVLEVSKSYKNRPWHWSLTIAILGIFPSLIIITGLVGVVLIPLPDLFIFILITSVAAFLLQHRYFVKTVQLSTPLYVFYCITGVALNLIMLMMSINFYFRTGEIIAKKYKVKSAVMVNTVNSPQGTKDFQIQLAAPFYSKINMTAFAKPDFSLSLDTIIVFTQKGVLGYPVYLNAEMVYHPISQKK
ncbi:MAG: zinc-dependent peptidase [Bacteroidota bacterium]